ncbi:MAG: Rrf2 family transcriptional regulator [Desulfobacteraceae bacterium]|nr:Rrf2 family transcriptional regulator [Desulfobacteraceae bacterium]
MKITMAAEYAVRCVLYLAQQGSDVLVNRQEIASQARIPDSFLTKIAQDLARAGIITIKQGAKGGYALHRPPRQVNMLEVVEAIIGEISLNECVTKPAACPASPNCAANLVWQEARRRVRETLLAADFEALAKAGACVSPFPSPLSPPEARP